MTRYPLNGRLSGSRSPFGRVQRNSSPPGFDPRTIQLAASLYPRRHPGPRRSWCTDQKQGKVGFSSENNYQGQLRTPQSVTLLCLVCSSRTDVTNVFYFSGATVTTGWLEYSDNITTDPISCLQQRKIRGWTGFLWAAQVMEHTCM